MFLFCHSKVDNKVAGREIRFIAAYAHDRFFQKEHLIIIIIIINLSDNPNIEYHYDPSISHDQFWSAMFAIMSNTYNYVSPVLPA